MRRSQGSSSSPRPSMRQYQLKVTAVTGQPTRIEVIAWDVPDSSYPEYLVSIRLQGVGFPSSWDALDALQAALDRARRDMRS